MTNVRVHRLTGLRPDALATYLAALGVLRVLAEQRDPEVRGFWRDEHFVLATTLDWPEIEKFLVEGYSPTPILAPWNMESGFFSLKPRDEVFDRSDADEEQEDEAQDETERAVADPLLDHFGRSRAARFANFRQAIALARKAIPEELRRAQEEARRAHEEIRARSAKERAALEKAQEELEKAKCAVEAAKVLAAERKTAAKQTPRDTDARVQLQVAKQNLGQAREREKNARNTMKSHEKELKASERRAASNPHLKATIAESKKRFKEVQASTKERLIAELRTRWGPEGQQWVDAAVALDERNKKGFEFTSLFGSGGNDGRMEFTRNFRHHLDALFDTTTGAPREHTGARLRGALFGSPTNLLSSRAVGQFFPGRAGGTNMGAGFAGGAQVNPWEFILMLEGAVALVSGMSRRGEVARARVASPFWVEAAAAGFGSAAEREGSPRGEQWLPLWSRPVRYAELVELIREARAQVGQRQTTRAPDIVRATARLGLARGIDSLQRFAYLERNGKSNLAVFAGRFHVRSRPHQELLEEIAPWIDSLVRHARPTKDNNVPVSLGRIGRRAQDALFSVCRRDATARDWRALLVTLGEAELALLRSGKSPERRPLPALSGNWIAAVDDGTPQGRRALRLALAFASQHRPVESENGEVSRSDSVRRHFMPLDDRDASRPRFKLDEKGHPEADPECVCLGRNLVADAVALVKRRSIRARSTNNERIRRPRLPLHAWPGCEVTLEEVGAWVRSEVVDNEILALVRPFLALNFKTMGKGSALPPPDGSGGIEPLHLLFRLAHLPFDVPVADPEGRNETPVTVRLDPEPVRRLAAGDLDGALRVVVRRLEASGLRPVFRRAVGSRHVARRLAARRLAASLAFPISQDDAARAARLVCKPYAVKDVEDEPAVPA